jgi:hypothetical protein
MSLGKRIRRFTSSVATTGFDIPDDIMETVLMLVMKLNNSFHRNLALGYTL